MVGIEQYGCVENEDGPVFVDIVNFRALQEGNQS